MGYSQATVPGSLHRPLPDAAIADVARRLRLAEQNREAVPPVRDSLPDSEIATAYAVQRCNVESWIGEGRTPAGFKIGLTSTAVQRQLGVDQPDFGALFADMIHADGAALSASRFIAPKVEAEVALVFERDLDKDAHTVADILRAAAFALPALEIVDSRIAGWDITLVDTVADNASAGAAVLGTVPVPMSAVDLRSCAMSLRNGGQEVSSGTGADCLGHPLNAAVWLADTQQALGSPVRAGDIVLTGALGPMVAMRRGDEFTADISGLGTVTLSVTS